MNPVGECAVVMRDVTWCQMAGWRLRLGQACTMTITRGNPRSAPGRFNVGEVQAGNGKAKVRAWMSSQGTLHRANSGLDRLNHDHPGKVAGANIEAAGWTDSTRANG